MVATYTPPEFFGYIAGFVGWACFLYTFELMRLFAKKVDNKAFFAVLFVNSLMLLTLPLPTFSIRFYDFCYFAPYLMSCPVPFFFFFSVLYEVVAMPVRQPKMEKHLLFLFAKMVMVGFVITLYRFVNDDGAPQPEELPIVPIEPIKQR